jgi:hypothetical protein
MKNLLLFVALFSTYTLQSMQNTNAVPAQALETQKLERIEKFKKLLDSSTNFFSDAHFLFTTILDLLPADAPDAHIKEALKHLIKDSKKNLALDYAACRVGQSWLNNSIFSSNPVYIINAEGLTRSYNSYIRNSKALTAQRLTLALFDISSTEASLNKMLQLEGKLEVLVAWTKLQLSSAQKYGQEGNTTHNLVFEPICEPIIEKSVSPKNSN